MKRKERRHCFHTFRETALGGKSLQGTSLKKLPFYVIFEAYCDMPSSGQVWTLIARFSNNDTKNWMKDNGEWWYDKSVAVGKGIRPSENEDMLSPAFWLVSGLEFKITHSDDPRHTALLQTTGNYLGKQTFRPKIKSYGSFKDGTVWASDVCLGNCSVQYGGQFQTTDGFGQATCSGSLQNQTHVGFWCDWDGSGGAVIGGGGHNCQQADHGIAITKAENASFLDKDNENTILVKMGTMVQLTTQLVMQV